MATCKCSLGLSLHVACHLVTDWTAMCLDMCMCVVRRTRSVCKSFASCVQHVQVGCCIVQPHGAHSLPIFLSVAVAHGRPWIHNSNNSNHYYKSCKQVGVGVVVERQVERQLDPYKQE